MTADLDRPCPHEDFIATVEVARIGTPVTGYAAEIRVHCVECDEPFRWIGVQAGSSGTRPMCSIDETELRAPLRPASSDPDFGLGIPGFAITIRTGMTETDHADTGTDTSNPNDHGIIA